MVFHISSHSCPVESIFQKVLKIFPNLDDLCHHGKVLWLAVCDSEALQIAIMVDHVNGMVFSCTEDHF